MEEKKVLIPSTIGNELHGVFFIASEENNSIKSPILIMCHGFTGDKYELGRFPETAKALNKEGYDVLIFDFSGSGENKREPITLSKQAKDLENVYNWVQNQGYSRIAVLGLSLGGSTVLKANLPGIITYIFWAPYFFVHSSEDQTDWFKDLNKGPVKIPSSGDSEPIVIDLSFMTDFAKFRVKPSLKKLDSPTLIVQGTSDESVPLEFTRKAFQLLPKDENNKLIEIQNATHDFEEKFLIEFVNNTVKWLKKYL